MKKFFFYFLNLTWGLPTNIIGGIAVLVFLACGHKIHRHGGCWYFEIGQNWGGLEIGLFFVVNENSTSHIKNHEFGHAIQNAVFGVFFPFCIAIPSALRYWHRKWRNFNNKQNAPYDSIWFERQATNLGEKYIKEFENNEN